MWDMRRSFMNSFLTGGDSCPDRAPAGFQRDQVVSGLLPRIAQRKQNTSATHSERVRSCINLIGMEQLLSAEPADHGF